MRMTCAAVVADSFGADLCIMCFLPLRCNYSAVLRIRDSKSLSRDDSARGQCPYDAKKIIE